MLGLFCSEASEHYGTLRNNTPADTNFPPFFPYCSFVPIVPLGIPVKVTHRHSPYCSIVPIVPLGIPVKVTHPHTQSPRTQKTGHLAHRPDTLLRCVTMCEIMREWSGNSNFSLGQSDIQSLCPPTWRVFYGRTMMIPTRICMP